MKIQEWMAAVLLAVITAASIWGSSQNKLSALDERTGHLESWKDHASEKLAVIETKIDLLLKANDISYKPK